MSLNKKIQQKKSTPNVQSEPHVPTTPADSLDLQCEENQNEQARAQRIALDSSKGSSMIPPGKASTMLLNTDEDCIELQSPPPNRQKSKVSSMVSEATSLRTGMLDDWLNEESVNDPLEYIMMDALSHLQVSSADKLLKSLQRSAQRAQRAERLVLKLKSHLDTPRGEGSENSETPQVAPAVVPNSHTWRQTWHVSCGWFVLVALLVTITFLLSTATAPVAACKSCTPLSSNETRNGSTWLQSNVSSDVTTLEELTAELESLHAEQIECAAAIQKVREKWRRTARQIPQVCDNEPPKRSQAAGASPTRDAESARLTALAVISEQQERIAQLQARVNTLQTDRSRCANCLGSHGIMEDCSDALREATVPAVPLLAAPGSQPSK